MNRDKKEIEDTLKYYLSQFEENDPDIAAFNLDYTETNEILYNLAVEYHSECQTDRAEYNWHRKNHISEHFEEELNR